MRHDDCNRKRVVKESDGIKMADASIHSYPRSLEMTEQRHVRISRPMDASADMENTLSWPKFIQNS